MNNKQLQREIAISIVTRSQNQIDFQSTHKFVYGMYDDDGIESFIYSNDWETIDGLETITRSFNKLNLRARYNTQRNTKVYLSWLDIETFNKIESLMENSNWLNTNRKKAKELLINNQISV